MGLGDGGWGEQEPLEICKNLGRICVCAVSTVLEKRAYSFIRFTQVSLTQDSVKNHRL